jgi:hypothetical protein
MSWKKWPRMAMRSELRIVNWPTEVMPPGPGFDIKNLNTIQLRLLVNEYINSIQKGGSLDDAPRFEKWTEGGPSFVINSIFTPKFRRESNTTRAHQERQHTDRHLT